MFRLRTDGKAVRLGLASAALLLVSGCADYLNHWDNVTLAAGDAVHRNQAIHTVEHLPPEAYNTRIAGNGKRTAEAYDLWWRKKKPAPQPTVNLTINTTN